MIKILSFCQQCLENTEPRTVLFVLNLLRIILQQSHNGTLLQKSRCDNFVSRYNRLTNYIQVLLVAARTSRDHGLNEVSDIAEYNTEPLYGIRISSLGLHGLYLDTLHYRVTIIASRLEYAPVERVSRIFLNI